MEIEIPEQASDTMTVFICYAREDREIARRLYTALQQAGVTPWMDTEYLLPGQNWKVIIPQVLKESSHILVLLSSRSVSKRGFVQKELKKALDILDEYSPYDIFVIPVRLDACEPTDERLQSLHWVDLFSDYDAGLNQILRVLVPLEQNGHNPIEHSPRQKKASKRPDRLTQPDQPTQSVPVGTWKRDIQQRHQELEAQYDLLSEKITRLKKARILETDAAVLFKLDKSIKDEEQAREKIVTTLKALHQPGQQTPIHPQHVPSSPEQPTETTGHKRRDVERKTKTHLLRREPLTVSEAESKEVFKLDDNLYPLEYVENDFEDQGEVVVDHATELTWQKSGSGWLSDKDVQKYIERLNRERFAGFSDWRLPTIPELMSLLEPEEQANGLYLNPIFDSEQGWCWSADHLSDSGSSSVAWLVYFTHGFVDWGLLDREHYVRVVRS